MNTEGSQPLEPTKPTEADQLAAKISNWGTGIGIILVLLGLLSLVLPGATAMAIEIWLAILFLCVGVSLIAKAFQNRTSNSMMFELVWGAVYFLGGLTLLLVPKSGIMTLALILGVVFFLDGIFRIALASKAYPDQRKTWWIFDGVLAIVLGGIILWHWPGDSVWIIGMLVGIRLLVTGMVTVFLASSLRRN